MMMEQQHISKTEIFILSFVLALTLTGIVGSYISVDWYDNFYSIEDGFIEWFTVIPLLITCVVALSYLIKLGKQRSWLFILCIVFIAAFTFFAAGEEISWGQRIFHIQSSEYFKEHNAQGETNLHNLVLSDGEKINKLVFSLILGIVAGIYLVIVPLLNHFNNNCKRFFNWAGVPVAQLYQIIGIVVVAGLHKLILSNKGKQPEVLEFAVCFMFLLIVAFPLNRSVFRKNYDVK